jgi:hypothetical protein
LNHRLSKPISTEIAKTGEIIQLTVNQHRRKIMNRKITDIIIHTSDMLDEQQFREVSSKVYRDKGIVSFNRNARTPRCFMVVYNAGKTRASNILDTITKMGIQASLVGI